MLGVCEIGLFIYFHEFSKKKRILIIDKQKLGGSHGLNAMIYLRGHRGDYDSWHRFGNPTWSYDEVLPYFKKSEKNLVESFVKYKNGTYHSNKGKLPVGPYRLTNIHPIEDYFIAAGKEAGYDHVTDFNRDTILGFTRSQGTIQNGRRQTTFKTFVVPAKTRPNLHIIKHAHATKIDIDNNGKAIGVEFVYNGTKKLVAKMRKEIIVSAGAISSPHLLMLSGVGPEKHLKKLNIPVKKNLAIGKNLQDHLIVPVFFSFHKSKIASLKPDNTLEKTVDFYVKNNGDLTNIGITDLVGYINTVNNTGYPDIEFHHFAFKIESANLKGYLSTVGFGDAVQKTIIEENKKGEAALVFVVLLNPKSKGHIRLNSTDPFVKPSIFANYLDAKEDWQTALNGVKYQYEQTQRKAFKNQEGTFIRPSLPDCDKLPFPSDKYFKCYINQMATTVYHPTGTCKMGPSTDKKAVVDSRLRMNGIASLRVCDASIMPNVVSSNTNAPTIMIAEKCADFIKEEWNATRDEL